MARQVSASCVLGIFGAAVFFAARDSAAQPVGVSLTDGVHVRAPFVSVDVFPHGGVSVRAPYTAVDVGGRPYYVGRPIVQPAPPSQQTLATMNDESLWRLLQTTSTQLNQQLNRFDTGPHWRQYLRLPNYVVSGSSDDINNRHAAIIELLQRFNDVSANPQYSKLSNLTAFTTMRAALSELASRQGNAAPQANTPEELPPPK